jgi:hypothetical protein
VNKLNLMKMALTAIGSTSDIFTDARECAASVAAAENLQVLARKLSGDTSLLTSGILKAGDAEVCGVQVYLDGTLLGVFPHDFDTSGRTWSVTLLDGPTLPVAMFAGEAADDETWVIDDPEAFYEFVLKDVSP